MKKKTPRKKDRKRSNITSARILIIQYYINIIRKCAVVGCSHNNIIITKTQIR